MPHTLSEYRVFFGQFLRAYQTTGAITPSSRWLAAALSRYVPGDGTRHILEVGPGTGAVTRSIVRNLRPSDRLDLVELNPTFVEALRGRFQNDPQFAAVADRAQVIHRSIEDLPQTPTYDAIVSGLPLNNFSTDLVERILRVFGNLLKPGGTLSFFEYVAVRPARAAFSSRADRQRLREIGGALGRLFAEGEFRRECVLRNFPPAWVHHVRFNSPAAASGNGAVGERSGWLTQANHTPRPPHAD